MVEQGEERLLPQRMAASISVIIPVLNEQDNIVHCLQQVRKGGGPVEIIVVDGGSTDQTLSLVSPLADIVVCGEKGRGTQMNQGANLSLGDVLLFLHADTMLPQGYDTEICSALGQGFAAGAFRLAIDSPSLGLRLVSFMANIRSALLSLPYGDQALFVRRDLFQAMNGFLPLPLMEDLEFVRRLRTRTQLYLSSHFVRTSARRWERNGILRTTLTNQLYRIAYDLGCPPQTLVQHYYRRRKSVNLL